MEATLEARDLGADDRPRQPAVRRKVAVAVLCLGGGVLPLAARDLPGGAARVGYGAALTLAFLGLTLLVRRSGALKEYWRLAFAFFVFALVQVLNNSLPALFNAMFLHQPPTTGDPLASTVWGSVAIQLLETAIAIVPILVLVMASGQDLSSIYARWGRPGWQMAVAVIVFVVFYFVATSVPLHRLFPMHGTMTLSRALPLTPALLLLVLSNGFQEEFLFRGLFLQRYEAALGVYSANVLQALVFGYAHLGVSYTPSALIFIFIFVFPLGLAAGFLMRSSKGVGAPAIFHAGADIPIYLAFLSYVA